MRWTKLSRTSSLRNRTGQAQGAKTEFFDQLEPRQLLSADFASLAVPLHDLTDSSQSRVYADFNDDGVTDIASLAWRSSDSGDELGIAYGREGGGFDEPVTHDIFSYSSAGWTNLIAGDFNGDDLMDVAFMAGDYDAYVSLQNADGSMSQSTYQFTMYAGGSIEAADMNGDGQDEIVSGDGYGQVIVWRGDSNGDFSYSDRLRSGIEGFDYNDHQTYRDVREFEVADIDNDGDLDVVAIHDAFAQEGPWISVLTNDGSGQLSAGVGYAGTEVPRHVAVGDLTGDGFADIATLNKGSTIVGVHVNNGDGTFGDRVDSDLGGFLDANEGFANYELKIADVTQNGMGDLLIQMGDSEKNDLVVVMTGSASGAMSDWAQYRMADRTFGLDIADLTGDGIDDVVTQGEVRYTPAAIVMPGRSVGGLRAPLLREFGDAEGYQRYQIHATDFGNLDGNGMTDAVTVAEYDNGSGTRYLIQLMYGDGKGNIGGSRMNLQFEGASGSTHEVTFKDVNGDGYDDILIAGNSDELNDGRRQGAVRVYINQFNEQNNSPSFGTPVIYDIERANDVLVKDFDGDGFQDFAATSNYGGGDYNLEVWFGDGSGAFEREVKLSTPVQLSNLKANDYDDDGDLDLMGLDSSQGYVYFAANEGSGERDFSRDGSAYVADNVYGLSQADMDGDGDKDLIVSVRHDSNRGFAVVYNTGQDGDDRWSDPTYVYTPSAAYSSAIAVSDVNGDRLPDLVGGGYGSVLVAENNGDGSFGDFVEYAVGHSEITDIDVADLDRDGDEDLLVIASSRYTDATPITTLLNNAEPPTIGGAWLRGVQIQGGSVRFIANDLFDEDGAVRAVRFFIDSNWDGVPQPSEFFNLDSIGSNNFDGTWTFELDDKVGRYQFLLQPQDDRNVRGEVYTVVIDLGFAGVAGPSSSVTGAPQGGSATLAAVNNPNGRTVVFEEDGQTWTASDLQDLTGAPMPTGDPVSYMDPKDGLTYVAMPSLEGLILFQRSASGEWTYRNLTNELGSNFMPTDHLVSWAGTRGTVGIAGIDASGRLVSYMQTGANLDRWTTRNLSNDIRNQGLSTPEFSELITYVTNWNTWTIAGLDNNGDIQGVWIQPGQFDSWRMDNLSEINGAPRLVGGLTAILSDWNGIHIGGLDANGNAMVSWWVPGFGGNWRVSNITAATEAPAFAGTTMTSFYNSWGGMNYAGLDDNGELMVYWWVPGGKWRVANLTQNLPADQARPTESLTSFTTPGDRANILGSSDDGDVVRVTWQPGQSGWELENLSLDASQALN